jgi:hypothetical protein
MLWTRKIRSQATNTIPWAAASGERGARRPAVCTNEGMNPAIDVASMAIAIPLKK